MFLLRYVAMALFMMTLFVCTADLHAQKKAMDLKPIPELTRNSLLARC